MDESSLLSSSGDDSLPPLSSALPPAIPPHARSGAIVVVDKHITHASLHTPLAHWLRRDVGPVVIALALLVAQALPALIYETQVWWIRQGEEEVVSEADDTSLLDDAAAAFTTPTLDDGTGAGDAALMLNATLNQTADAVITAAAPSATQLAIDALPVPPSLHFYFMYLIPAFCFGYVVLWLSLYWNVKMQVAFRYRQHSGIKEVREATHVRVEPVEHGGKSAMCPLQRLRTPDGEEEIFFIFQKTKYIYEEATREQLDAAQAAAALPSATGDKYASAWFAPLDFPVARELQSYLSDSQTGLSTSEVASQKLKYGENVFDIPLPPFADLFKEHAMAPFFVFQILCVLLWCLDEYWYYSLVTLFMLVMFECTVVKRRLKSLEFLREMRAHPYKVYVLRGGAWVSVPTSQLLPRDVISLVRPSNEQFVVPADILLLSGSVVVNESMLTGESVPQQKESLESSADQLRGVNLDIQNEHKRNILFGGTKIVLHNAPSTTDSSASGVSSLRVRPPPDGGCIGFVLRTGFNTSQGRLVRTILFSSEQVSVNNVESLLFIGVLLVFAIIASAYVCIKGLEDKEKSRYKLMLNCIMIVTSVVPPELPMELSLAVNTSLLALMKCQIFCTEPFRIPLAGAVDICCFDKTGTLTSDEFIVKGIAGIKANDDSAGGASAAASSSTDATASAPTDLLSSADAVPLFIKYVIAGCHSLTYLPGAVVQEVAPTAASSSLPAIAAATGAPSAADAAKMAHLIGDPLEKSSLAFVQWGCKGETSSNRAAGARERLRIVHKYPFSSALKRMSCVVALEHDSSASLRVVTKGAAEILQPRFDPATLPANFTEIHTRYSQQGCRVLALGYKELSLRDVPDDRRRLKSWSRDTDIECGLTFAGFLVLACPLKKDSKDVIRQLKESSHQVMIITGDHALTACAVAAETAVTTKVTLILQCNKSAEAGSELYWQRNTSADTNGSPHTLPFPMDYSEESLEELCAVYDLCVGGEALDFLLHSVQDAHQLAARSGPVSWTVGERMALFARHVCVFARTSPEQKELLLHWLKLAGMTSLMCGDGVNDVGALKQAHIGVALIGEDAAKAALAAKPKKGQLQQAAAKKQHVARLRSQHEQLTAAPTPAKSKMQQQLADQLAKLEEELGDEENLMPRLGDASIASPFTSKLPYITCCVDIIRQGRCTLVTTLQMFNILGINCLISAYSMSVLHLAGVKWGDTQMTIASLSIAMFFLFISRGQPLKQLSAERPHTRLFTPYMLLSVLGQFALHMFVLLTAIAAADPHTPQTPEHKSPEKVFKPNVLNTVVFLVSNTQTVATFAANYRGRPFMESLRENTGLFKSLWMTFALMLALSLELFPDLNKFLELHELPSGGFQTQLVALLLFDVISTYVYAHALKKIFAIKPTKKQRALCKAPQASTQASA